MKPSVLILGARAPIALEMSRSFREYGCKVILADSMSLTLSRWSRSGHRYIKLPPPATREKDFIEELNAVIKQEGIDHVIPTCEEALYLSKNIGSINSYVWTSSFFTMKRLHNKKDFAKLAASYFTTPVTIEVDQFSEWSNASDYVFKKVYSRFATTAIIGKDETFLSEVKASSAEWIAQERIFGKEVCVYSIWKEGVLKAFCAYEPVYRIGQGSGIFFRPWFSEELFAQVQTFGAAINYNGQLSFDFIVNDAGNYVLECNPRGTSGAHLLNTSLASCFLDDDVCVVRKQKDFSIKWAMLALRPRVLLSRRFHRSNDVIWRWSDPLPFLLQPLSLLEISYIRLRDHKSWLCATTGDIEWNGDKLN